MLTVSFLNTSLSKILIFFCILEQLRCKKYSVKVFSLLSAVGCVTLWSLRVIFGNYTMRQVVTNVRDLELVQSLHHFMYSQVFPNAISAQNFLHHQKHFLRGFIQPPPPPPPLPQPLLQPQLPSLPCKEVCIDIQVLFFIPVISQ